MRVAVAYVARTGAYGPLWVAKDEALFDRHGLDVRLRYLDPAAGVQALVAGEVDIYAGGTAALAAALAGAAIVYIGSLVDRFVLSLVVQPDITRVSELRGTVVGVTRPGAPTEAGAHVALRSGGLVPHRDVTLSYLEAGANVLRALRAKVIHGGMISPPITAIAREAGLRELVDLGKRPERFPQTAFIARRNDLAPHRERLLRFFRGYGDGVRLARERPARAREIIAKYTQVTEPGVLVETYDAFAPLWAMPPLVSEAAIETALSVSTNPRALRVRATDFIDNRIVEALSARRSPRPSGARARRG